MNWSCYISETKFLFMKAEGY